MVFYNPVVLSSKDLLKSRIDKINIFPLEVVVDCIDNLFSGQLVQLLYRYRTLMERQNELEKRL
jgi:hypothetical protein